MKFIFLSGSFHRNSRSLAILKHLEFHWGDHDITTPKLDTLPFYSEDFNDQKPEIVSQFIEDIRNADGLVFCTPEYNHSVPAVLKNAIDWASRPAFKSVLKDKPVTIITQAVSPVGGARAQAHLKLILDSTLSKIHMCHEMMITQIDKIFDHDMNIVDEKVTQRLSRHMNDFMVFAENSQTSRA